MRTLLFLGLSATVSATTVPVCLKTWKDTFLNGPKLLTQLDNIQEAQAPADTHATAALACKACVSSLISTKNCELIQGSQCYAVDVSKSFAAKEVEVVNDPSVGIEKKTIGGDGTSEFTYVLDNNVEGALDCKPVLFKAVKSQEAQNVLPQSKVDAECSRPGLPVCSAKISEFEYCCTERIPGEAILDVELDEASTETE